MADSKITIMLMTNSKIFYAYEPWLSLSDPRLSTLKQIEYYPKLWNKWNTANVPMSLNLHFCVACRLRSIAAHRDHFVRRLSVCACVRACVCLSDSHTFLIVTLVNTIETKPLHISLSNLQDMLTVMRGCTLLILEVRGQRSRSHWTSMEISLWTQ